MADVYKIAITNPDTGEEYELEVDRVPETEEEKQQVLQSARSQKTTLGRGLSGKPPEIVEEKPKPLMQRGLEFIAPRASQYPMKSPTDIKTGLKQAGMAALDVLEYPTRAIDYATSLGGLTTGTKEIREAAQEKVPDILKPTVGAALDPSTYLGIGMVRNIFKKPTQLAAEKMAQQLALGQRALAIGKKPSFLKRRSAELLRKDPELLEEAARPGRKEELAMVAREAGEGGVEELTESVQRTLGEINTQNLEDAYTKINQVNKSLDDAIIAKTAKAEEEMTSLLNLSEPGIKQSETGAKIGEAIETAKGTIGERFEEGQKGYLTKFAIKKGKKGNIIEEKIDAALKKSGFEDEFRGVEKFGNVPAEPQDITDALYFKGLAGKVRDTKDALNQLRLIRKMKGSPKQDGSFYNARMLGEIDGAYQEAIEDQLSTYGQQTGVGDDLAKLWRANNETYKTAIEPLGLVQKKLGIGKTPIGDYAGKIEKLGANKLLNIKQLAAKDDAVAGVWNELSNGYFDDLVQRSLDNGGNINIKKFKLAWEKINATDPEIKAILLGPDKVNKINSAIQNFEAVGPAIKSMKEKAKETVSGIESMAKRSTVGKELTGPAAVSRMRNIGGKTGQSQQAIKTLQFLDDFYETSFVDQAMEFYKAKELGFSKQGRLPWITQETTGRSLLGPVIGAGISKIPFVGKPLGVLIGIAGQSPAGAIALYRQLNNLSGFKEAMKATIGTKKGLAGTAIGSGAIIRGGE